MNLRDSIEQNVSLELRNCLAVPARCQFFQVATNLDQLNTALDFAAEKSLPVLFLAGGSNIVLSGDFTGIVIQIAFHGRGVLQRDDESALIELAAGENWHEVVCWCVDQEIYGLENLALIPGSVGAAPIQNIGAYGVELERFVDSVGVFEIESRETRWMSRSECQFGYRDSIFKRGLKDQVVITSFRLRLPTQFQPNIEYQALANHLQTKQITPADMTANQLVEAVCEIRRSKLPDPVEIPNVGSFFKNPVVKSEGYVQLKHQFPELVGYAQEDDTVKMAAAQLIELCGWKGYAEAGVGVHSQQALVLINPGHCSGEMVLKLASRIADSVMEKFAIRLEIEPRVY